MERWGITKLAGKNNYISLYIIQDKWEYRTHSSTVWLLMFDTSIDTVSNTLFYLLTSYVRYQYRYCIEHTLLPSDCLCSIPVSILYRIHSSTFWLLMFDTSIDTVSNTLFYLLTAYVRYQYRTHSSYLLTAYTDACKAYRTVPWLYKYSRLPEDEPSGSKRAEDIKIKN